MGLNAHVYIPPQGVSSEAVTVTDMENDRYTDYPTRPRPLRTACASKNGNYSGTARRTMDVLR